MNLSFVCFDLSGNGGIETVITKVANECIDKHNVNLFLTNVPENDVWLKNINSNVNIIMNNKVGKIAKLLFITNIFVHAGNDEKFIILGANTIRMARYIRNVLRRKWTITSWIHFSLTNQTMFNPNNIRYADNHWAISSAIKNQMLEINIPENNIDLIFNPVSEYVGELNVPNKDEKLKLVFVGHIMLDGQKNLRELMNGLRLFGKQVEVDLYGSPDELDECKNYAKKIGVEERLVWHDWTNNPWKDIINNVHPNALIMTSKFEGLPMVILEAQSRGIPAIVSSFDGYKDVIMQQKNGLSYELGNHEDLAKQLNQLKNMKFDSQTVKESVERFYDASYFSRLNESIKKL